MLFSLSACSGTILLVKSHCGSALHLQVGDNKQAVSYSEELTKQVGEKPYGKVRTRLAVGDEQLASI